MTNDPEDLSVQEWLYQISYQLEQQNQLLRAGLETDDKDTKMYRCKLCDEEVSAESRESHMREHKLPEGIRYNDRYERV